MEPEASSSSDEEVFYGRRNASLPVRAVRPAPADDFASVRELTLSQRVSRLSALRESLEERGQSFIDQKLEPLAWERHRLERLHRVMEVIARWTEVRHGLSAAEAEAACATELAELEEQCVLAHGDYLSQRLAPSPNQEKDM